MSTPGGRGSLKVTAHADDATHHDSNREIYLNRCTAHVATAHNLCHSLWPGSGMCHDVCSESELDKAQIVNAESCLNLKNACASWARVPQGIHCTLCWGHNLAPARRHGPHYQEPRVLCQGSSIGHHGPHGRDHDHGLGSPAIWRHATQQACSLSGSSV